MQGGDIDRNDSTRPHFSVLVRFWSFSSFLDLFARFSDRFRSVFVFRPYNSDENLPISTYGCFCSHYPLWPTECGAGFFQLQMLETTGIPTFISRFSTFLCVSHPTLVEKSIIKKRFEVLVVTTHQNAEFLQIASCKNKFWWVCRPGECKRPDNGPNTSGSAVCGQVVDFMASDLII